MYFENIMSGDKDLEQKDCRSQKWGRDSCPLKCYIVMV